MEMEHIIVGLLVVFVLVLIFKPSWVTTLQSDTANLWSKNSTDTTTKSKVAGAIDQTANIGNSMSDQVGVPFYQAVGGSCGAGAWGVGLPREKATNYYLEGGRSVVSAINRRKERAGNYTQSDSHLGQIALGNR
jgi:hypothetical protein